MMRNLPNNYTRDMFLSLLDEEGGLSGLYDFVYLPMDFCRDANLGYAFVNLVKLGCWMWYRNSAAVHKVWTIFDGFERWALPTAKAGQQMPAVTSLAACPALPGVPDCYKPMIFENGVRKPFPRSTKKVKAPVASFR
eukprot:Skav229784  [mRNA]  locus=scaffold684:79073:80343:- [translate_table: standard]